MAFLLCPSGYTYAQDLSPVYRINAGGASFIDSRGTTWEADSYFNTGETYARSVGIAGTGDSYLYQTSRFDRAALPDLRYSFPVAPGLYRLRLHFAEVYWGTRLEGSRVFDVYVEGSLFLASYDIVKRAGFLTASVEGVDVQVQDGALDIDFRRIVENPCVSGIEVLRVDGASGAFSATPTSLDFGDVLVPGPSDAQAFSLSNGTASPVTVTGLTLGGPQAASFSVDAALPLTVPAFSSVPVSVVFAPGAAGAHAAEVSVVSNAPSSPQTVSLAGRGVDPPYLQVDRDPVDAGSAVLGSYADASPLRLTNGGGTDLVIAAVAVTGPHATEFSATHGLLPLTLAPGAFAEIAVRFTPAATGTRSATLAITSNDPRGAIAVGLAGRGVEAVQTTAYRINAGGGAYVDSNGRAWTGDAGFYNTGWTYSRSIGIAGTADAPLYQTERYDKAEAPDMVYSLPVSPGRYLVRLHFAEIYSGNNAVGRRVFSVAIEGQTVLHDFDIFAHAGMARALIREFEVECTDGAIDISFARKVENPKISAIEVLGLGGGMFTASPASIDFGTATVGQAGAARKLTLSNGTGVPVTVSQFLVDGAQAAAFVVDAALPLAVPAGGSVDVDVLFNPVAGGTHQATLEVVSNGPGSPASVALSGQGVVPPAIQVSPASVSFGSVAVGTPSAARSVQIANTGGSSLVISELSLTGAHAAEFQASHGALPLSVAPGASVSVSLTFTPSATGARTATLNVASNAPSGPATVGLQGSGVAAQGAPRLEVSIDHLSFGRVAVGAASLPQVLTLANTGEGTLVVSDLEIGGAHPVDFVITGPTLPWSLDPGAAQELSVRFVPVEAGNRSAGVTVVSNDAAGSAAISLSGAAQASDGAVLYRVNAGGPAYTDRQGQLWSTDTGYCNTGTGYSTSTTILGTDMAPLYQSERYDPPAAPQMVYSFPVLPGQYKVRLHFAEIYSGANGVGRRVFSVAAEGRTVIQNLDIFAQVGMYRALVREFEVECLDGALDVAFIHNVQNPKISAIEVEQSGHLRVDPDLLEWGHVYPGEVGETKEVVLTNDGAGPITITGLGFQVNAGMGHDFVATLDGLNYFGEHHDVVHPVNTTLLPGESTVVTVQFLPTEEANNDVSLRFTGNFAPQSVRLMGTGGEDTGHPFLHVVIRVPAYAVDYDGDGYETVALHGSDSHTHELGRVLSLFEWRANGFLVSTEPNGESSFALGEHTVSLTIYDDNSPPESLTDSATVRVVRADAVPGVLALYYNGVDGAAALMDAVPAQADYAEVLPGFRVDEQSGRVGGSPFTDRALVRLLGQVDIATAGTYQFTASGGLQRRVYVAGSPVTGPLSLGAGRHTVEARFAVDSLQELPLTLAYALGAGSPQPIPGHALTHSQVGMLPVINEAPAGGSVLGGESVELRGLGFFPTDQVSVEWGATLLGPTEVSVTPTSIFLNAPPATAPGIVDVRVRTPQGLSNAVAYSYTSAGPAPVQFSLSTASTQFGPTQATWGADGRLYVGGITGAIVAYTFDDNYGVVAKQTISTLASVSNPNILGIAVNPLDPPGSPVRIYVAHGLLYANGGTCFDGFSPYSGQVSVLTGPNFDTIEPLITGLPVSNHDHGINGMEFDHHGDLYICVGGNTNAGIIHCNMGGLPESPLAAAVLKAELSKPDFNGQVVYLETATGLPNNDQVYGHLVDVAPGVDVSVFASGFRNPYDLVLTTRDMMYVTDNGPNAAYGAKSLSATTQGPGPTDIDELNLLEWGSYYGHPNRTRGRYDARQNVYRGTAEQPVAGNFTQMLTTFLASTNGITEYRATTFNNALRGDLIAQKWKGVTYRITLSPTGRSATSTVQLPVSLNALDVVTGPGGVLLGIDYTGNKIVAAKPVDAAADGLTPYDIHPWRAPTQGGTPFVIGGSGFGSLANTAVTIGGAPATLTSVSPTRIRGIVPPSPRDDLRLLDVAVTVNSVTKRLPEAFRYVRGRGADTGTRALFQVTPGGTILNSSTYTSQSFKLTNLAAGGQKITRMHFDLAPGLLPDCVFDPFGVAGDPVGKGFSVNADPGVGIVSHRFLNPRDGGFDVLEVVFNDFDYNETLAFSADIDPTNIKGAPQPGPGESGSISGLEIIGARLTVFFDDGTVRVGELFRTGSSVTNSHTYAQYELPPAPRIEGVGHRELQATVATPSQKVRIGGPEGATVSLIRVEAALYLEGVPGGGYKVEPYEANTALAVQQYSATIGPGGYVDVPVTLTRSNADAGYNYFRAYVMAPDGKNSPASPVLVLYLNP